MKDVYSMFAIFPISKNNKYSAKAYQLACFYGILI